jgi:hypothetical protein
MAVEEDIVVAKQMDYTNCTDPFSALETVHHGQWSKGHCSFSDLRTGL